MFIYVQQMIGQKPAPTLLSFQPSSGALWFNRSRVSCEGRMPVLMCCFILPLLGSAAVGCQYLQWSFCL